MDYYYLTHKATGTIIKFRARSIQEAKELFRTKYGKRFVGNIDDERDFVCLAGYSAALDARYGDNKFSPGTIVYLNMINAPAENE